MVNHYESLYSEFVDEQDEKKGTDLIINVCLIIRSLINTVTNSHSLFKCNIGLNNFADQSIALATTGFKNGTFFISYSMEDTINNDLC